MKKDHLHEARLVDLSDDDLKEVLGRTYQDLKNLEEAKKLDPEFVRLTNVLNEYVHTRYSVRLRTMKARLKAARMIANSRNIMWRDIIDSEFLDAPV